MKGPKGDAGKPNIAKGGPTVVDTGPLFPRLHINETEKAGPRAPPRNKMALYEQFTVPSHRFLQTNRASGSSSSSSYHHQQQQQPPQQYQSDQYQYTYLPCYVSSSMPYANAQPGMPMFAQPAYGVNSCGMSSGSTVINDEEPQKVPRVQKPEKSSTSGPSRILKRDGASSGSKTPQEEKIKDLSDAIGSASSSSIMHDKRSSKLVHMFPVGSQNQKHHLENVNLSRTVSSAERQRFKEITGSLHESQNTVDVGLRSQLSDVQSCKLLTSADKNQERRNLGMNKCDKKHVPSRSGAENDDGQEAMGSLSSPGVCFRQSGSVDVVFQDKPRMLTQSSVEPGMSGENMMFTDCPVLTTADQCCLPSEIPPKSRTGDGESAEVEKDVNSCVFSSHGVIKAQEESSGESKNNNGEVSEPSQQATAAKAGSSNDSAVSMLISVSSLLLKPKDVIQEVGQQQFWKARKTLLRQQRIFSDQVFQLHKLIRVQQLLAETPGTLIDEEMHFGVIEDCEESPPTLEKAQQSGSCFKEPKKSELLQVELSSRSAGCHQTLPDATNSSPTPASLNSTVVSAWGYPSFAMGQWFNPMATQGRPFLYQPYGAAFPPGQTVGGPFGSTVMGQVSAMVPFGIPFYGQYGSVPATAENAPPLGQPLKDVPGSWNIMQMNFNQGGVPAAFGKAVPAGSGASVNQATPVPGVNTSNNAGMEHHWGNKVQPTGLPSTPQAKTSSPSVFGRHNSNVSTSIPSVSNSKKSASNQEEDGAAQNLDLGGAFRSIMSNVDEDGRRDDHERLCKWSKIQKDSAQVSDSRETVEEGSRESLCNALELFPAVPSLSPNSKTKPRAANKSEEWRGKIIKAVPRPALAASQSTAGILLSLQRERQH